MKKWRIYAPIAPKVLTGFMLSLFWEIYQKETLDLGLGRLVVFENYISRSRYFVSQSSSRFYVNIGI